MRGRNGDVEHRDVGQDVEIIDLRGAYPVAAVLGRDGIVYVVADNPKGAESVIALDGSGRPRPDWPVSLPGPISNFVVGACFDWCGPYYATPLVVETKSGSAPSSTSTSAMRDWL